MTSIPCLEEVHSFPLDVVVYHDAAHPGGGFLTSHIDYTMGVWSEGGDVVAALDGGSVVSCVACSPWGDIVVGYHDSTVKVWGDRARVLTCRGHGGAVYAVAVSPLDGTIVSGSSDNTGKVWDGSTGECVAALEGHTRPVAAVCVLDNGDVVTGSEDGTVRVWGRTDWTCAAVHETPSDVMVLTAMPLGGFAVGGGSEHVSGFVSAWREGKLEWEVETGSPVFGLAAVHDVVISSTVNEVLVTASGSMAWMPSFHARLVALRGGKVALMEGNTCRVYRVVRPERMGIMGIMCVAWEAHGGAPPHADVDDRAAVLARTLSLRRFCRPRGESEVGRGTEIVEPFAQAVVAFL